MVEVLTSESAPEPKARPARKPKQPTEPKPVKRIANGERLAEMAARPEGFFIADVMEILTRYALVWRSLRREGRASLGGL